MSAPPGIRIRPLETAADYAACIALQELTWGRGFNERVPAAVLRLAQRLGGIASGAFAEDGMLVGFVFGMSGLTDGRIVHWSDMLAVHPSARDRGIGEALKRHQREWLLELGITLARWTFDPLEARNAWLNFARLGATAREYVRDFYRESDSPLHAGLPTDRLIVEWRLADARVVDRLEGRSRQPSLDDIGEGAIVNLPRAERANAPAGDAPALIGCEDAREDLEADRIIVALPPDIQLLKRTHPALARRWRDVTRRALETYLGRGRVVSDAVRSADWTGLVLEPR